MSLLTLPSIVLSHTDRRPVAVTRLNPLLHFWFPCFYAGYAALTPCFIALLALFTIVEVRLGE